MKVVSMIRRRQDLTPEQFRTHYENIHAPAGCIDYHFVKYIRNYVDKVRFGDFLFDVIVEFYPDLEDPAPTLSGDRLAWYAKDRDAFMDTRRAGGPVQEQLLQGSACAEDIDNTRRVAVLLNADASETSLATRLPATRITLDKFTDSDSTPAQAIMWLWTDESVEIIHERMEGMPGVVALLETRAFETPLSELLKRE